jgi:hypothetical protein
LSHFSSGLSLLFVSEQAVALDESLQIDCRTLEEEGRVELLVRALTFAAAGHGLKAEGRVDYCKSCENVVAAAAARYLRRISSSRSLALSELLLQLLPLLQPDRIDQSAQIEVADAMAEASALTPMLQNPFALSQIVMAAKMTEHKDVKSSLVKLLSRLFFNCPAVQQEIMRLNALPLLHEISAVPTTGSSSSLSHNIISELSRAHAQEQLFILQQRGAVGGRNQDDATLSLRQCLLPEASFSSFSSAWLSPLNGSIWRLDSSTLSEQMSAVAELITDASSARAFSRACGGCAGLLRPLCEHGHSSHEAAFAAVMRALCNAVVHSHIRRDRLAVLSLFPDGHWPCVVTTLLCMVALHPSCALQARVIVERLCGDAHGQLGMSVELLQLKAFELQAAYDRRGCEDAVVESLKGVAAGSFPGDGSCLNFSQDGLRFARALAQMMMNDACADLLETGLPENVQLLRAYLAMERGEVLLADWLGHFRISQTSRS